MNKIRRTLLFTATGAALLLPARADNPPSALNLQYATVVPHGDTISCYAVPVAGADGTVKNYDIELHLTMGADGTVKADATKVIAAAVPDDSRHFLPGDYVCIAADNGNMTVTGPVMSPSGREIWSFTTTQKDGSSHMGFADGGSWVSGTNQDNPMLQGIAKDAVLPKNLAFGRTTHNYLLGFQQLGDKLVVTTLDVSYDGTSVKTTGSIIFQRKPPQAPPN